MPFTRRTLFYFGIVLLCVPMQYYITEYINHESSENLNEFFLTKLYEALKKIQETFFNFILFRARIEQMALYFFAGIPLDDGKSESPALEVLKFRENKKNVKGRPQTVTYRIGQVVRNLKEGYKGVIIGWQLNLENDAGIYTLLVDESENKELIITEIPQDHIYLMERTMVKNHYIQRYFYSFDGSQYIPRPWLRAKYPKD